MNLAAILGFFVVGSLPLPASAFVAHGAEVVPLAVYSNSNAVKDQGSTSSPGTSSPSTSSSSTSPSQPQAVPAQNPAKPSHLSTKKRTHAKKAIYPDCSTAPTTLNPVLTARKLAKPDSAAQSGSNLRSDSNMAGSTGSGTATGNSTRNSHKPAQRLPTLQSRAHHRKRLCATAVRMSLRSNFSADRLPIRFPAHAQQNRSPPQRKKI